MKRILSFLPHALAVFPALIFLQSLTFKFSNAPETQTIFGKLDAWAANFGAAGVFSQTGVFSQYVIGSAEGLAALLLLVGILPMFRRLQALGALLGFSVIAGAVFFHLFTPLGIDPNNDGGALFVMAVLILFSTLALIFIRRNELFAVVRALIDA